MNCDKDEFDNIFHAEHIEKHGELRNHPSCHIVGSVVKIVLTIKFHILFDFGLIGFLSGESVLN